jgi:SpoVK/Ycf46/Vps4 family AAA+-type ATPase
VPWSVGAEDSVVMPSGALRVRPGMFFDEADALFGSRSEVRDARDRYANQEVAYLLQRIENFDGITVLATNLRGNLDAAFARRLHFIITFPDRGPETRSRLWTSLLDATGPTADDDPVDIELLAEALPLTGGEIRNIVLSATFAATPARRPVAMSDINAAAVREFVKLGRRIPPGPWQS